MLSDETAGMTMEQINTQFEPPADIQTAVFKLHATNFEAQKNDDQLYPGKLSDKMMKKLPMMAVFTSEFDFYRRDCLKYADRLKKAGKLIDISDMPGVIHGYNGTFDSDECKWFYEQEKQVFDMYINK